MPGCWCSKSHQVLERVEKMGDLFEPVLQLKQKLPKLPGIGEGRAEAIATGLDIAAQADGEPRPRLRKRVLRNLENRLVDGRS